MHDSLLETTWVRGSVQEIAGRDQIVVLAVHHYPGISIELEQERCQSCQNGRIQSHLNPLKS